VRKNCISFRAE